MRLIVEVIDCLTDREVSNDLMMFKGDQYDLSWDSFQDGKASEY